MIKKQSS